jgi:hypothetical protein
MKRQRRKCRPGATAAELRELTSMVRQQRKEIGRMVEMLRALPRGALAGRPARVRRRNGKPSAQAA